MYQLEISLRSNNIYLVYIYVANIRLEIGALLWSGLGHIHILAMGCGAVEIEELAKVVVNHHLNPEDCSGMTWAESAEGWKTEGFCLMKVELDTTWKAERKTETDVN